MRYEVPVVIDYGGLKALTAAMPPGGPEDCAEKGCGAEEAPPGHSPPPGPPGGLGF